jgi:hypothetical protein
VGLALVAAILAPSAHATTFSFGDEYYLAPTTRPTTSTSQWAQTIFGTTNGVGSPGVYQGNNGANSTQIVNVGSSNGSVSGEWALSNGAFTNQFLSLSGWGQSLNSGQQVADVYNRTSPSNGSVLYFQYMVSGAATPFTFNGFDLHMNGNGTQTSFTLEGLDASSHVLDSSVLTVTGNFTNTYTTETLDWTGVTTVEIVSTPSLPVNWGSGTMYMDNVEINDPVSPVPEPVSMAILGSGLVGLGVARRRRSGRAGPSASV